MSTPTLDAVRRRGALRAVVSRGIRGLSMRGDDGRWSGLDTDVARAVAAAAVGDAEAVEWVPSDPADRLSTLAAGDAELTVANVSWTLGREASSPVLFAGVTCYDGEGFLIRADSGITRPEELAGRRSRSRRARRARPTSLPGTGVGVLRSSPSPIRRRR